MSIIQYDNQRKVSIKSDRSDNRPLCLVSQQMGLPTSDEQKKLDVGDSDTMLFSS